MVTFAELDWSARVGALGDQSEAAFEAAQTTGFLRTGLNRPPLQVGKLHPYERHRPDYLTGRGYVECVGVSKDQILKLRLSKWEALRFWRTLAPVYVWVLDSYNNRTAEIAYDDLDARVRACPILRFANDQHPYYKVPAAVMFG